MISYFVTISTKLCFQFQTQISTSSWPHDGVWPKLMEYYNITYRSKSFTAQKYNELIMDGPECYNDQKYLQHMQALMDYQKKNLMKVKTIHVFRLIMFLIKLILRCKLSFFIF